MRRSQTPSPVRRVARIATLGDGAEVTVDESAGTWVRMKPLLGKWWTAALSGSAHHEWPAADVTRSTEQWCRGRESQAGRGLRQAARHFAPDSRGEAAEADDEMDFAFTMKELARFPRQLLSVSGAARRSACLRTGHTEEWIWLPLTDSDLRPAM